MEPFEQFRKPPSRLCDARSWTSTSPTRKPPPTTCRTATVHQDLEVDRGSKFASHLATQGSIIGVPKNFTPDVAEIH